jgi:hypothetical protein
VLTLSLPSLDHNGHEFGPRSHEVQDVLARADVNIGRLLDAIDQQVGSRYVLGFSSDHGVAMLPEQITCGRRRRGPRQHRGCSDCRQRGGRKGAGHAGTTLRRALWIGSRLLPGVYDLVRQRPNGLQAVKTALAGIRGIAAAYSADDLIGGAASSDRVSKRGA